MTGSTDFEVLVPSRPPEIGLRIPPARLIPDGVARRDVSEYFTEPDGQELTCSAMSSDDAIVSPSISNVTLSLAGGTAGVATITVTATDPGGLSASQEFMATVVEPVRLLRDDFESNESLDDWLFSGARRQVANPGRTTVYWCGTARTGSGYPRWAPAGHRMPSRRQAN